MPEKKFYLESTRPLQGIGMRVQVVSFLISKNVMYGNVINDAENTAKVIVAVRDNDENKIRQVKEELVKYLNNLHKDDFCYEHFPQDITASELMELNNPHSIEILPLGSNLADSLMLEQTSKGVGAMIFLAKSIRPLHELPDAIKQLTEQLARNNKDVKP